MNKLRTIEAENAKFLKDEFESEIYWLFTK